MKLNLLKKNLIYMVKLLQNFVFVLILRKTLKKFQFILKKVHHISRKCRIYDHQIQTSTHHAIINFPLINSFIKKFQPFFAEFINALKSDSKYRFYSFYLFPSKFHNINEISIRVNYRRLLYDARLMDYLDFIIPYAAMMIESKQKYDVRMSLSLKIEF